MAYLIHGYWMFSWAWDARGGGSTDTVGGDNYNLMHERLYRALEDTLSGIKLAPNNVEFPRLVFNITPHLGANDFVRSTEEIAQQAYQEKFLDDYACQRNILFF